MGVGEHLENLGLGEMAVETQRLQQAAVPEGCSRLCGSADGDVPQGLLSWLGMIPVHIRGCDPDEAPEEGAVLWIWSTWDWLLEAAVVLLVGNELW